MAADLVGPAKDSLAAGKECLCLLKRSSVEKRALKPGTTKKRKATATGSSAVLEAAYAKSVPGKKMTRLPQADVARILARVIDDDRDAPSDFKALKLQNPDLIPSPEEEMDEEMVAYYAGVRAYYKIGEDYSKFQAWVRSEYAKNGYVEVDDDFLAKRARVRADSDRAREDMLKTIDFSDDDEDLKRLLTNRWY
ncbi:hypothetical protein CFC21_018662 [Triticum aestivum]|uniref:Uncharacterized protein n=2 Tax=Triticum aestivum TaxID=4565 RepID=A0A3B6B4C0_WHEAT|nr:hypothetical protein CFC21_018662 [Triticum aestivum]